MKTLEIYVTKRLALDEDNSWTEDAIVTLVWIMATAPRETTSTTPIDFLHVLDRMHESWNRVLSPAATHAAFIVGSSLPYGSVDD